MDRIKVKEIWLERVEGPRKECGQVTVRSFMEADEVLKRWARTAPGKDGGYDKCDFTVTYTDGETYAGRYDLKRHDMGFSNLLGWYMVKNIEWYAGRTNDPWVGMEHYQRWLQENEILCPGQRADNEELLDNYEIGY